MIWTEMSAKFIILLLFFVIRLLVAPRILCSPWAILSSAESATASLCVFLVDLTASASRISVAYRYLFCCRFSSEWVWFYDSTNFDFFSQRITCSFASCGICVSASSSSANFHYSFEQITCPEITCLPNCTSGARQ